MICFAGRRLAVLATPPQKTGAEYGNCTRASGLAIRGTAPIRSPPGASSESRTRVIGLEARGTSRYTMLALQKTLAGVAGFEPAKTGFGDQRPSYRVLTPVAIATGG